MRAGLRLAFWWFIAMSVCQGGGLVPVVIGPFRDSEQCEIVRREELGKAQPTPPRLTECWADGR